MCLSKRAISKALILGLVSFLYSLRISNAEDFASESCIQHGGQCISWAPRRLVFSLDEREIYFPFAFHQNRRQITPWAVGKLEISSGKLSLVERSCDQSFSAIALADDGITRATVVSLRPKKYSGPLNSFVVRSYYRLRLDTAGSSAPVFLLDDNELDIHQIEFQRKSENLYLVRPLPLTGGAQFERINLANRTIEGVYPLSVPAHRAQTQHYQQLFNPRAPGFHFYSEFSISPGRERITVVGWSPTTRSFLQSLVGPRGIEDRIARTLHLVYVIDLSERTLKYHEIHDRDGFERRWFRAVQYVGDSLFLMPEREWHERSNLLYEYKDGALLKRADLPGIVLQVRVAPSGNQFAYASRKLDKDPNPSVFLSVDAFDGKRRLRVGPREVWQAFSSHLECRDFFDLERNSGSNTRQ